MTILAEPVVAVVDRVVDRRGTRTEAEAYLRFLYSAQGQEIIAQHSLRPIDTVVAARHTAEFPAVATFSIDDPMFGGWKKAQQTHFADGGVFDQIFEPGR